MEKKIISDAIDRVVYRLLHLGGADYDADKTASRDATKTGVIARDFGIEEWDWPQGVGIYGLLQLQKQGNDPHRYDAFLQNWFENNVKIGLPSKNINTTAPMLTLAEFCGQMDDPQYEALCLDRAEWLMQELPKTKDGGFQHVTSAIGDRNGITLNEGELWLDTLFMAGLFLARMGVKYGRKDWAEEAGHQFLVHIKYLYEKKDGLFYHGWSFLRNDNFGGIYWCRGNSWFTYAAMAVLEILGEQADGGVKSFITDTFRCQAEALLRLQGEDGLWHTVLTDPESYGEVSGSAAIAAGLLKGIKLGVLGEEYRPCAEKAIAAICANVAEDGTVLNVSAGTGMGMDAEHYKKIIRAPMAYGQSLTLLALIEAL